MLGWPKKRKLARAFLREYIYKGLKLAQLLGQLGGFLTWRTRVPMTTARLGHATWPRAVTP